MKWELFRWVWKLQSPLFIGLAPAGSLNRTRLYVPARSLWGAFTAELSRRRHNQDGNTDALPDYKELGETLSSKVRFSYMYPAEQVRGRWLTWLPEYKKGSGLVWRRRDGKEIRNREFRLRLLDTRPSTAIDARSFAAQDRTLREVECIQTHWRPDGRGGTKSRMAFAGYVFISDGLDENTRETFKNIREIFVGGEIRYGFGQLRLINSPWDKTVSQLFDLSVEPGGNDPVIKGSRALAHVLWSEKVSGEFIGAVEPLVGWDRGNQIPLIQPKNLYFVPGSSSLNEKGKELMLIFSLKDQGLWEILKKP